MKSTFLLIISFILYIEFFTIIKAEKSQKIEKTESQKEKQKNITEEKDSEKKDSNENEKDKEKEKENHMMTEEEFETKLKEVLEEKRIRKNHKITKDKLKEIFEAIYEKDFILPELPEDPKDEEDKSNFDPKEESKRFLNEIFFKLARSLDYDDEIKPSEIKEYISPKRVQVVVGEIAQSLIDVMGNMKDEGDL